MPISDYKIKNILLQVSLFTFFNILIVLIFWLIQTYNFDIFVLISLKYIEFFILFFIILLAIYYSEKKNFLFYIVIISIVTKYIYGVIHYNIFDYFQDFPMSMGAMYDEHTYFEFSKSFAPKVFTNNIFDMAEFVNFPINYMGYPYFISLLMNIFGSNDFYHIIINPIFMTFTGVLFYCILINYGFNKKISKIFLILFLFWPSTNYFSILNLKDSLMLFILMLAFYSIQAFTNKNTNIFIKAIFFVLFLLSTYLITFFRIGFLIFPLGFLIFNMTESKFSLMLLVIFGILFFSMLYNFYEKISHFFTWEYISILMDKTSKWGIIQKYPALVPILFVLSPILLILPMPVFYPFPASTNTNISTEIFKIPIDLSSMVLYSFLFYFLFYRKLRKEFLKQIRKFPYVKMVVIIFALLMVSNYITYERHRMILEMFLLVPASFVLYKIINEELNLKLFLIVIYLLEVVDIFFNYTRGITKGVF